MRELVYAGKDVENKILKEFPLAKIKDASDDVHLERFEVEENRISEEEFWKFAIREGFIQTCLGFGLRLKLGFKDKGLMERLTEYARSLLKPKEAKNG